MTNPQSNFPVPEAASAAIPDQAKTLHVTQINSKLTEDDILPIFSAFGEIRSVNLVKGRDSKEAYVEFRKGTQDQNQRNIKSYEDGLDSGNGGLSMSAADKAT